jgi:hypothetical protein
VIGYVEVSLVLMDCYFNSSFNNIFAFICTIPLLVSLKLGNVYF